MKKLCCSKLGEHGKVILIAAGIVAGVAVAVAVVAFKFALLKELLEGDHDEYFY